MKKLITLTTVLFTVFTLGACGGSTSDQDLPLNVDPDGVTTIGSNIIGNIAPSPLSAAEEESLAFMREEEKLARDVYTELHNVYGTNIFINIAKSEQSHADAVLTLIERYDLVDPMQIDTYGLFQNTELQLMYDTLVVSGSISFLEALYVGARVEELDIYDLQNQLDNVVDNEDIIFVYQNLLKGSRNHLRAFDKQIKNSGGVYAPVYITQELYDSIVASPFETN